MLLVAVDARGAGVASPHEGLRAAVDARLLERMRPPGGGGKLPRSAESADLALRPIVGGERVELALQDVADVERRLAGLAARHRQPVQETDLVERQLDADGAGLIEVRERVLGAGPAQGASDHPRRPAEDRELDDLRPGEAARAGVR